MADDQIDGRVQRLGVAGEALDVAHDLGEGEHADEHRKERNAALEPADAESKSRLAHHGVVAQDRDHAAERAGKQTLEKRAFDQTRDHREREDEKREVLPRAELERELRERPGRGDEDDGAEEAAEDRGPDPDP
jgi:hypothetical protein